MIEEPYKPNETLTFAFQFYQRKEYKQALTIAVALLVKYQASEPVLILIAACACQLNDINMLRKLSQVAKNSKCWNSKEFKFQFYEILLVAEFNCKSDEYFSIAEEIIKVEREACSANAKIAYCYHYLLRFDMDSCEQFLNCSPTVQLCFQLLKGETININDLNQLDEHELLQLPEYFAVQASNHFFQHPIDCTRAAFEKTELLTLEEEKEMLLHAKWYVSCYFLFDVSGEELAGFSDCSRILNEMIAELSFCSAAAEVDALCNILSTAAENSLLTTRFLLRLPGVFHNMSLVCKQDQRLSKLLSAASLICFHGSFEYSLAQIYELLDTTDIAKLQSEFPGLLDIYEENTEYLFQFSTFLTGESQFEIAYNIYLAVNQQEAQKHYREHVSVLLFQAARALGFPSAFLVSIFTQKQLPFAYDGEGGINSMRRLTSKQIHYLLSVTDVKNELLMDTLLRILRARQDNYAKLLRAALLLVKTGLNSAFSQAFSYSKNAQQDQELCRNLELKQAKPLFQKYELKVREEVEICLQAEYQQCLAPRQLLICTLCFLNQFEVSQFKSDYFNDLLLRLYDADRYQFVGEQLEYIEFLFCECATKFKSPDLLHFTGEKALFTPYKVLYYLEQNDLAAALSYLQRCDKDQFCKLLTHMLYEKYNAMRSNEYDDKFKSSLRAMLTAEFAINEQEPWLIYPNAVMKKSKGNVFYQNECKKDLLEYQIECWNSLCGKNMVRDISEYAGSL